MGVGVGPCVYFRDGLDFQIDLVTSFRCLYPVRKTSVVLAQMWAERLSVIGNVNRMRLDLEVRMQLVRVLDLNVP